MINGSGRDWKGGLVPNWGVVFGKSIRVIIPAELADETALLAYLGLGAAELRKIWYFRRRMYRNFSIAKGPKKVRMISAPDERLKFLQRKLADKLSELYRPRNPVHGFVAERSVKTNAIAHLHRRFIVNVDLRDFFPTISQKRVEGMLSSLGIDARVVEIIGRICCNNGSLPQGAPSSPVLSNMICFRLDKQLMGIAKEARSIYTRYADDITFSSHQPLTALFETTLPPAGRFSPDLLTPKLRGVFQQNGFAINPDKAHYAERHSRRIVTGLKINELLNVDRRYVRNIRAALHSIETLGLKDAEKKFHEQHGGRSSLAAHLQGKISFLTHIKGQSDPVVPSITLRFNKCFPTRPINVKPTQAEIRDRAVWVVEYSDVLQGTAFFLKGVGLVTAAHCVRDVNEVEVFHPSKHANKFKATVRKRDEHRDLAILEHRIPATDYFELDPVSRPIATGDSTTAVGYPKWAPGDMLNIRPGFVSTLTVKSAVRLIEVTQKLTQGMSGGPLLDANDAVAGIIHKGGPEEGRDFAVHIQVLEDWLRKG
jgi:RNA-directed DNA polymerase